MQKVSAFIKANKIEFTAARIIERPDNGMADLPGASHWKTVFRRNGKTLTTYYSMGSAHTKPPKAEDVLDSLSGDAACAVNAPTFREFCGDLGYDEDSRSAERVFKACQRIHTQLVRFLGVLNTEALLFNTERL